MSRKHFLNKSLMYQYDKEIASAFQVDCEMFLDEFEKYQSFSFTDFRKVWHQRTFSYIFAGQTYALLLRDFCENCFYVIKKYIMFPRTVYTQVGAFYLLYALYYKQPLRTWVKIRLTLEEYKKLYELILEMVHRKQLESVYIFAKMKSEQAFLYIAQRKPLGPEDRFVKDVQVYMNDTFATTKTQSSLIKFQELYKSPELFDKLQETNTEYSELMRKYAETHPTLTPFESNIAHEIQNAYLQFQNESHSKTAEDSPPAQNSIRASRNSIKSKAMANKKAIYRAAKKCKTALDYEGSEDSESTDE